MIAEDSLAGSLPPPRFAVDIFLGPMVIGIMMQQFLLGIIWSQAVAYFRNHFNSDSTFYRTIATCLITCTVLSSVLNFASLYRSLVLDYGDSEKFDHQDWIMWMQPSFNAWTAFIAHVFYIFRCWAVTRSLVICTFLGTVALSALVSGITITIFSFSVGGMSNLPKLYISGIISSISAILCDLGIVTVLVVYFLRRRSVLRSSDAIISRLVWTTIETGPCTAICVFLNIVLFLKIPKKAYGFAIQYTFPDVYTISVLYTLLGRQHLRNILNEGSGTFVTEFQTSFLAGGIIPMSLLDNRFNRDEPRLRNREFHVTHDYRMEVEQSYGEDNV